MTQQERAEQLVDFIVEESRNTKPEEWPEWREYLARKLIPQSPLSDYQS